MIKIKFNSQSTFIDCGFSRLSDNVVSLTGTIPQNTSGFLTYRTDGVTQLGDFSDYVTVYRVLDDGVQFSNDGSIYVPPAPPTLEEVKAEKKRELTACRDAEEFKNVTTNKGTFEFDDLSQSRLLKAMNAMTDSSTRNWTDINGNVVTMSKADFQAIFDTAATRSDTAYAKLRTLKTQVDNATTVEEVQSIKWED